MDGDWEIYKLRLQKENERETEEEEDEEEKTKGREGKGLHKSSRASESLTLKHRAFLKKKNGLYLGAKLKSF